MGSIAMAIVYGLKVNWSVAMVAMVNHTALWHEVKNNTELRPKPDEVISHTINTLQYLRVNRFMVINS